MKIVAQNKNAFRKLQILEKMEAGIALCGTEVKSIRDGKVQLVDAYVQVLDDEAWLAKAHISEYSKGSWTNHIPTRRRKLLLHKREIRKLRSKIDEKGLTILPLKMYFNERGFVKVEIGVGRGKKQHDRREDLKKRDATRDIQRAMRER